MQTLYFPAVIITICHCVERVRFKSYIYAENVIKLIVFFARGELLYGSKIYTVNRKPEEPGSVNPTIHY